jgi:hypothetical protein
MDNYSKLNKNCARAPSPLRGEGWGEGANGEKTQEPIMSMYNQVAIILFTFYFLPFSYTIRED